MTKGEFLYNLRSNLSILPKEEIENIIEDYSMHINELLDEGESLEQILNKLGDPKEIAKQYIEELDYEDSVKEYKNTEAQYRVNESNYEAKKVKSGNIALFVFMQIVNFLFLVGLTTISSFLEFIPIIIPSYTSTPGSTNIVALSLKALSP